MGVLIPGLSRMRSGPKRVLVLGYGHPRRRDDALGPRLAEALDRMSLPDVDARRNAIDIEHAPACELPGTSYRKGRSRDRPLESRGARI